MSSGPRGGRTSCCSPESRFDLVPLGLLGIWTTVGRGEGNGLWNSLLALMLSDWLFHSAIYPISAHRYMLPAFVGLLLFLCRWFAVACGSAAPKNPEGSNNCGSGFSCCSSRRASTSQRNRVEGFLGRRCHADNGVALERHGPRVLRPNRGGGFRFCGRDEGIVAANHRAPREQISTDSSWIGSN